MVFCIIFSRSAADRARSATSLLAKRTRNSECNDEEASFNLYFLCFSSGYSVIVLFAVVKQ